MCPSNLEMAGVALPDSDVYFAPFLALDPQMGNPSLCYYRHPRVTAYGADSEILVVQKNST